MGLAHAFNDFNLAAPAVLLPFFVSERQFSYSAASGLVMALGLTSSLWQPLMGVFVDRHPVMWTAPVGLVLGGAGIALAGVLRDYAAIFACIALSGIGIAGFHPATARLAGQCSRDRGGEGMGLFAAGGSLGFAASPMVLMPLLLRFGLRGSSFAILPSVAMAVAMAIALNRLNAHLAPETAGDGNGGGADRWSAFARLAALLVIRAAAVQGIGNFLPLYITDALHGTAQQAGAALSLFSLSGVVGTILGGPLADRYGCRRTIIAATSLTIPLAGLFLAQGGVARAIGASLLLGVPLVAPFSAIMVLGQEYLPNHVGFASGVTLGIASSIGMLVAPLFGWIADIYGLRTSMMAILALPIVVTLLGLTLPRDRRKPLPAAQQQ